MDKIDKHDKEFETYLRQFRLRLPGHPPEFAAVSRRNSMRWLLVAAVVVLAVGITAVLVRNDGSGSSPKATVEEAGSPSMYRAGESIEAGQAVRSNSAVGLVLALEDGSRVEMREQSELKLESAGDGIRVRLNDGSIVVTAAKQTSGSHLYVQTRDAVVSVVGTVFLVTAEQSGTSVAVVEGEVHVQQGADSKKLLPGEQVATNSKMQLKTVAEQISWSRSAAEYIALLQQPATPAAPLTPDPVVSSEAVPGQPVKLGGIDYNDIDSPPFARPSSNRLPFNVQANYIRVTTDEVRTLITIQFMNRDLAYQDVSGGKRARAHIEGSIDRIDGRSLRGFSEDVMHELPASTFAANLDEPVNFQWTRYLTPGTYKLHLTVIDKNSLNSQNTGVLDYVLNVPRISDQTLQASSMILAYSITDLPGRGAGVDPFTLGDKKVKPNVTGIFKREQSLNVWQEFYGLSLDQTTGKPSATFELLISQNKQEIRKLISISAEPLTPGQSMTYTSSATLAGFATGVYDIQLKVTDNLAKASFVSTGRFTVAAPPVQSEPTRITSGKQIFDRECTSCHNADVATRMQTRGVPLSKLDLDLLSRRRTEMAQLLSKGLLRGHPEVVRLQGLIAELEAREVGVAGNYRNYISRHLAGFGKALSTEEVSALAGYLYEETGRKLEQQGTPQPVQPTDKDAPKEDPDVAGARILNSACTTCHDLSAVTGKKEDRASWERIINGMVGIGAGLKDAEIPVLADYLFRHYGPKKEAPKAPEPVPSDIPIQERK